MRPLPGVRASRNASGLGNLQLVSGLLYNGIDVKSTLPIANVITVALPEPEPALGVGMGALALALIGLTRARRQRQR